MKKNKCQAFTKKNLPCQNYAMKGSDFCNFHKGLFKDTPPVKITALICPYCDEPLRKDAKFCSFCKEGLTTVKPKPDKLDYYGKLIDIRNRIAAKDMKIGYRCFIAAIFLLLIFFAYFFSEEIYLMQDSLWVE